MYIDPDSPLAIDVIAAIRSGYLRKLKKLLADNPGLSRARIGSDRPGGEGRSLLHVATDWPGHYPSVADTISVLADAGAHPNARFIGSHAETPLHWAASSNDVEALDALIDAGADIEAPGAVLGGGPALADATGFGQWNAARRLVERGAKTNLWDASSLGLMDRMETSYSTAPLPSPEDTNRAFWYACHGGQREPAEFLLTRGADINWIPGWERKTPLDAAARNGFGEVAEWLHIHGGVSAINMVARGMGR